MKYGNLNFLEPSGPLQACNWTALPLPYIITHYKTGQQPQLRARWSFVWIPAWGKRSSSSP